MAKPKLKTKPTDEGVTAYLDAIDSATRRTDADLLLELYSDVTGLEPIMWGPSIIGYGSYHYKYDSGREGDAARAGFSSRKNNLSLYFLSGYNHPETEAKMAELRAQLGKHKMGASCLNIKTLADVNLDILRAMIELDFAWMNNSYPV